MRTNTEILESLEGKIEDLVAILKPDAKSESNEVLDELKNLNNKIEQLDRGMSLYEKQKDFVNNDDELADTIYDKKRKIFVMAGLLITAITSIVAYMNFLPLFSTIFGYFIAMGGLAFVLVFDYYVLPGNTIKRISNNAIASALVIFSFVILVIAGSAIGNSLITNRERSEEYTAPSLRPSSILEQESKEPTKIIGDTTNSIKEN